MIVLAVTFASSWVFIVELISTLGWVAAKVVDAKNTKMITAINLIANFLRTALARP